MHIFSIIILLSLGRFNSIEHLWGYAKNRFRRVLMAATQELDKTDFEGLLNSAFTHIPASVLSGLVLSNRQSLIAELQTSGCGSQDTA